MAFMIRTPEAEEERHQFSEIFWLPLPYLKDASVVTSESTATRPVGREGCGLRAGGGGLVGHLLGG